MNAAPQLQRKCACGSGGNEESSCMPCASKTRVNMPKGRSSFVASGFAADFSSLRVHDNEPPVSVQTSTPVMLQRAGDPLRVPLGLACPVASDSPTAVTNNLFFPHESALLNPTQKSEIEALVRSWRSAGASAPVRVDGFASEEGTDEFNWVLSCRRALAVRTELLTPTSGRTPGIPSSFVRSLAQGETTQFGPVLADNRRATIETTAGIVPPVVCGTAPPCPVGTGGAPLLINPGIPSGSLCRGACGPNCPPTCTPQPNLTLCIPDSTGSCHVECTYTGILECGSHQGCRDHDACYDNCAATLGETDLCHEGGSCHCGCDFDCATTHGPFRCNDWRRGLGPFDRMLRFSNPATSAGPTPGACPP